MMCETSFETFFERFAWFSGWVILFVALFLMVIFFVAPAHAAPVINPSVESQPFLCQNSLTRWICDMEKPGPGGATGAQGLRGYNGTDNFSTSYYNSTNFTSWQNSSIFNLNYNFTTYSNYTTINEGRTQELDAKIETQQKEIDELKARLDKAGIK